MRPAAPPSAPADIADAERQLLASIPLAAAARFRDKGHVAKGGVGAITQVHDATLERTVARKTTLDSTRKSYG